MDDVFFFDSHVTIGRFPELPENYSHGFQSAKARLGECGIEGGMVEHVQSRANGPELGHRLLREEIGGQERFRPIWNMLPIRRGIGVKKAAASEMKEMGVSGVALVPEACAFSPEEWCCGPLYDMLEEMRMPLFVNVCAGGMDFGTLDKVLANHPGIPVILRDLSYQADSFLYPLMERHENLRADSGGYKTFDGISSLSDEFGWGRLVFGSDYPRSSPGAAVTQLLLSGLPAEGIAAIAGKNMTELIEGVDYDI